MARQHGTASVEEHPKGSGRYRVRARLTAGGGLKTIASGLPKAEAEETANAFAVVRDSKVLRDGITLDQYGQNALDRREQRGVRGVDKERARWSVYVSRKPLGQLPLTAIRRRDVLDWRDSLKKNGTRTSLSFRTKTNALNLLRHVLDDALDREVVTSNPARDVRVPKGEDMTTVEELSGVLTTAEQERLVAALPESARPPVLFALLTGVRLAEQWWLRWEDIEGDDLIVRRSVGGKATKGKKPRRIRLLGPAQELLDSMPRTSPWIFPAPRGGRRHEGHRPAGWSEAVVACKFGRRVRWHDLRHTCATSLLAGWWGRRWSLEEVRGYLGHSSVKVTERYARILDVTVSDAVEATFPEHSQSKGTVSALGAVFYLRRGPDSNRRVTVLQSGASLKGSSDLDPQTFPVGNERSRRASVSRQHSLPALALALAAESLGLRSRGAA